MLKGFRSRIPSNLVGTSNVMFAQLLGLKAFGTNGHRYTQMFQGIVHPIHSQSTALSEWVREYEGKLGIALNKRRKANDNIQRFCAA